MSMNNSLIRTQIYLPKEHQQSLAKLANARKVSKSELIREALERFLTKETIQDDGDIHQLMQGFGVSKDRDEFNNPVQYVAQLRQELSQSREEALKPYWNAQHAGLKPESEKV